MRPTQSGNRLRGECLLGWISVHRKIVDNWVWKDKPFSFGQAWIDLIMMANHEDKEIVFEGKIVIVPKGSLHTSIVKLSDRFGWERKKTTRFLNLLETQKSITTKRTAHGTTITIENYCFYQNQEQQIGQQMDQHVGQQLDSTWDTNNKINKNNKIINKNYSVHFEAFWKAYPRKKEKAKAYKCYLSRLNEGFSEDELMKAAQAYSAECQSNRREERYIKLGSTFLGPDKPFVDYLKGVKEDEKIPEPTSSVRLW